MFDRPKSSMARKPKRNHPWQRHLRHNGLETYNRLSDARFNCMMASLQLIIKGMKTNPLWVIDDYKWIHKYPDARIEHVIRVCIRGKVYMKDKYLPDIATRLGELLEMHHWKFGNSCERLCGIEYFIKPDWDFWLSKKEVI